MITVPAEVDYCGIFRSTNNPNGGVPRGPKRRSREILLAHLKRILRLGRLRLRGPRGAQFEFTLAAIAQNLRRLAKLVARPPPLVALCVT
jgi:hypothetical protein